jgi:hypothetical protein
MDQPQQPMGPPPQRPTHVRRYTCPSPRKARPAHSAGPVEWLRRPSPIGSPPPPALDRSRPAVSDRTAVLAYKSPARRSARLHLFGAINGSELAGRRRLVSSSSSSLSLITLSTLTGWYSLVPRLVTILARERAREDGLHGTGERVRGAGAGHR